MNLSKILSASLERGWLLFMVYKGRGKGECREMKKILIHLHMKV